jgi:hypothetical protein
MTAPHARVSEPWVISDPDDQGDRWVHAKDEVTVCTARTFHELIS